MRTKEFIISVAIFTVIYTIFWIIVDFITNKKTDRKYKKNLKSLINIETFDKFARFYGIQSTISFETLLNIQSFCSTAVYPIKISELANRFAISQYELIISILFFEYLNFFPKKAFDFECDMIKNPNTIDLNLVSKYNSFFLDKKPLEVIANVAAGNTINDLIHLNKLFLIPGVRLINNKLYYIGDLYEEN